MGGSETGLGLKVTIWVVYSSDYGKLPMLLRTNRYSVGQNMGITATSQSNSDEGTDLKESLIQEYHHKSAPTAPPMSQIIAAIQSL
jgi:hypothetical protein